MLIYVPNILLQHELKHAMVVVLYLTRITDQLEQNKAEKLKCKQKYYRD